MAYLKGILSLLQLLVTLWRELRQMLTDHRRKKAAEKSQKHDEAIDKAKEAKTPEEAYDSQTDIVNNKS